MCRYSVQTLQTVMSGGAGANALSSLVLQCLWESFALPVIVTPLVAALTADQPAAPRQPMPGQLSLTSHVACT